MSVPTGPTYNINASAPITSGSLNILVGYTPPPHSIAFCFENKMLTISFDGGIMYVKSDMPMDESAKRFLEFLKPYIENYVRTVMPHDNLKYLEWCEKESRHER